MDFGKPYKRADFVDFVGNSFLGDDYVTGEKDLVLPQSGRITGATVLGRSPSMRLTVIEFIHESEHDPRVLLSRETFSLMKTYRIENALAAYYSRSAKNWRFSLVTTNLELDDATGKVKRAFSNPRRYSFFLGMEAKTHTAEAMLEKRGRVANFADLIYRFSLEVVNKDFYSGIAKLYTRLVGGTRLDGNAETAYAPELVLPGNPALEVREEFAVRLIGRTVFTWFLKRKGLIPEDMLSSADLAGLQNYYHKRVEPLFFQALNTPQKEREKAFRTDGYDAVPFLNGGLFAPHTGDFYEYNEATQMSCQINTLKLPDGWFKDFLELLETYNFTVDENTSVDIDLAIDPEMLGRIFENLLAEINPETGETARHRTGSYYTPRAVVEYMVTESLVSWLLGKVWSEATEEVKKSARGKLEALLSWSADAPAFTDDENRSLIGALHDMKCLDPACGSGAFPMSILQKAILALERLDPDGDIWIGKQVERIPDTFARESTRRLLTGKSGDYARKLGLIEHCIYGVDIQPIAVEMARLRAFLALIVDETVDDTQPNRGIRPLPNLEFKFVCGDSLAKLPEEKNKEPLFIDSFQVSKLEEIRAAYLDSSGKEKEKHKQDFLDAQSILFTTIFHFERKHADTKAIALSTWNPFSDDKADWFDPFWMFGIKEEDGGFFDIVIANPPYVQLQKNKEMADHLEKEKYSSFSRMGDLYCLFYERGFMLLKNSGRLCYISSNKWMRAGYGEGLRLWFLRNVALESLIDFGDAQLFESATTYTNILLGRPQRGDVAASAAPVLRDLARIARADSDFAGLVASAPFKEAGFSDTSFLLLSEAEKSLKKKIEGKGIPLRKWDISINYGIKTGLNEAFIMDRTTRDRLIAEDPKSVEVLKPVLRGRDIKRYKADFQDLWLIFTRHGTKINNYPAIKHYLEQFKADIEPKENRDDKKGRKPGSYKWFEIQDNVAYWQDFEKEKIVWAEIVYDSAFTLDSENYYLEATAFFMTGENLRYLIGCLNSRLLTYLFRNYYAGGNLRGETFRYKKAFLELLPLVPYTEASRKRIVTDPSDAKHEDSIASLIEDAVDKILNGKKCGIDTSAWEQNIDTLVYELYGLNDNEIAIVEGR